MIEVKMGVNHEVDTLTPEFGDGGFQLRHHLGKLVVDHHHAILSDRNRNVATGTKEHVQPGRDSHDGDFDRIEIPSECGGSVFGIDRLVCENSARQGQS